MSAPPSPEVSEVLAAYEIEGEIGRGSWGVVLKARHRQLGREVAVKQLPVDFSSQEEVRRRFVNEARLLASLDHPHIVPVYDYIEKEGVCLLVMEYLPGGTVWKRFNAEGFDYIDSVSIALATCAGLHYAHRHGVLHRDIKPENLIFSSSGILKVTDFGIAKVLGAASTMGTRAGEVLGSPAYIAPEQATGTELGPFTDVYATAVVLYELLSGRLPFPDDGDPLMVMYRHVHEAPRPLKRVAPEVPDAIAQVIMHGLSTSKENRYQTAEEFGVALAEAATASFGPGWLQSSSIPVMGSSAIIAATERITFSLENIAPKKAPNDEVLASESGLPALAVPPNRPQPETVLQQYEYPLSAQPQALSPAEAFSGREEKLTPGISRMASVALVISLVLGVIAVLLAFLGPSKTTPSIPASNIGGVSLSVQGTSIKDQVVTADFQRPVDFRIELPPGRTLEIPDTAKLVATASLPGGILVPMHSQPVRKEGDTFVFLFEGRQFKYLVAGKTTLYLKLEATNSETNRAPLPELQGAAVQLQPVSKNLFAIPTIVASLTLLAVLAYVEALLIPLKRRKKRVGPVIGLGALAAVAGIALGYLGWALGTIDPSAVVTALGALLFAASGVALGLWAFLSPSQHS